MSEAEGGGSRQEELRLVGQSAGPAEQELRAKGGGPQSTEHAGGADARDGCGFHSDAEQESDGVSLGSVALLLECLPLYLPTRTSPPRCRLVWHRERRRV